MIQPPAKGASNQFVINAAIPPSPHPPRCLLFPVPIKTNRKINKAVIFMCSVVIGIKADCGMNRKQTGNFTA